MRQRLAKNLVRSPQLPNLTLQFLYHLRLCRRYPRRLAPVDLILLGPRFDLGSRNRSTIRPSRRLGTPTLLAAAPCQLAANQTWRPWFPCDRTRRRGDETTARGS